jgi:cytochrome c oxidase subunit 4
MHSDMGEIKKSVRKYFMVGAALFVATAVTVAANQVHLVVPLAITVALIIAITKGSMVAAVFMHLSNERRWIYGALLLTVAFFVVLMFVPLLTTMDGIGTVADSARAPVAHGGIDH